MGVMSIRPYTAALAALACLTALSACSDDKAEPASGDNSADVATGTTTEEPTSTAESTPAEEPTPTADPDLPSDDDLQAFVEAITSTNTAGVEDAFELTAEGSLAHAYVTYLAGNVTALVSGGDSGMLEQVTVTGIDDGFKACTPSAPNDCDEFTNFEGQDGLIVDLAVNGKPLRGNIVVGDGKPVRAGDLGTIELVAARVNRDGNLFVVLDVRSAAQPVQVGWGSSSYRNENGRQVEADGRVFGPLELGPDSLGTVLVSYLGSELGGVLTFPLFADDFSNEQAVTFHLK
jgi:hypothetical protein